MKKENKIVILLFIMAFSSVVLLYAIIAEDSGAGFGSETPVIPTKTDIGKTIYVEGTVLNKRMTYTGDNCIANIECSDHSVLMIFIPKSSGAASVNQTIEIGDYIGLKGEVEEYNGTLEVVLKNESNLKKLK
jgi:OB-fold nucleic acid binding domain.